MNSTPAARRPRTALTMSCTASAECWMPSPRLSSAKMLICESLKNGRNGSLFANFTPDAGSHITIDFSPEPWPRSRLVATSSRVERDLPELLEAQHVLHPQQRRLHRLEVRGQVVDRAEAEPVAAPRGVDCAGFGTNPGNSLE